MGTMKMREFNKRKSPKDDDFRDKIVEILSENPDGMSFSRILREMNTKQYDKMNQLRGKLLQRLKTMEKEGVVSKEITEESALYRMRK